MLLHILRLSEIEQMYQRVIMLLDRDVKVIGNRSGWHQFIGEKGKVGDVATAQAILIFGYLKHSHRLLKDFKVTLRQAQHQGENTIDSGGWSFLSSRDFPTVEPTAWSIMGLLAGGEPLSDIVMRGIEWLKKNQNANGGWGPRRGLDSRTYTTFMAANCLSRLKPYPDKHSSCFHAAQSWLAGCQNANGGWGPAPSEASTPVHTAFALLALIALGVDPSAREIRKAIRYLYDNWDRDSMWERTPKFEQYEIPKQGMAWTRITFHYFPTPWIIVALLAAGEDIFREELFLSVKWIIHHQNSDGSWSVEGVPKKRLWAIHDAILALVSFLDKAISTKTIDRMVLLDEIIILTKGPEGRGLAKLVVLVAAGLMLLGAIIGAILGSATGLHLHIGTWVQGNWAWILLGLYIVSVFPLVRLRVISWKEAIIGMLLPALLVVIQVYLRP